MPAEVDAALLERVRHEKKLRALAEAERIVKGCENFKLEEQQGTMEGVEGQGQGLVGAGAPAGLLGADAAAAPQAQAHHGEGVAAEAAAGEDSSFNTSALLDMDTSTTVEAPSSFELSLFPEAFRTGSGAEQLSAVYHALVLATAADSASADRAVFWDNVGSVPEEIIPLLVDTLRSRGFFKNTKIY